MFLHSILMAASLSFAAQPKLVLQKIGSWTGETTYGLQVRISGDSTAYVTGHGTGLAILNVKDPTNPVLISPAKFGSMGAFAMPWLPGKVLVAYGNAGRSYVVDVRNPASPVILDSLEATEGLGSVQLEAKDSLIIAPIYNPSNGALVTYRWTSEGKIEKLGALSLTGAVWAATVQDTLVAVSLGTPGIGIVSIKDPAKPVLLKTLAIQEGSVFETVWKGKELWCITSAGTVYGFDISNLAEPKTLGKLMFPSSGRRISRKGNFLFATQYSAVSVIDITKPTAPTIVASASGSDFTGVTASDSLLYVNQKVNGLLIYRWKHVYPPELIPTVSISRTTPTLAWHAQTDVAGYLLTVAADSTFKTPKVLLPVSDTSISLPTKFAAGTWYWKVSNLPDSVSSAIGTFFIAHDSTPLPYRINGDTLTGFPTLRWSPPVNYKGSYAVEVSSTADFKIPLEFEVSDTTATLTLKPSAGKWFWRVSAGDAVSPVDSFTYKVTVGLSAKARSKNSIIHRTNTGIEFLAQGAISIHSLDGKLLYAHPTTQGMVQIDATRTGLRQNTVYLLRNGSMMQTLVMP